jgi:hypothetical protein
MTGAGGEACGMCAVADAGVGEELRLRGGAVRLPCPGEEARP